MSFGSLEIQEKQKEKKANAAMGISVKITIFAP